MSIRVTLERHIKKYNWEILIIVDILMTLALNSTSTSTFPVLESISNTGYCKHIRSIIYDAQNIDVISE